MTEQHGALTLLKTDHLLLGSGGYEPTITTEQGKQSNNIDVQAVNWGINLLNKYYPGLGQVTFQPVQQLLPANPLIARQWADIPRDFSQDQYLEKDKFQDPNAQPESQINSEIQANKINQQPITGNGTTALSPENNNQFAISKNNMKRFLFMPSDQIESAMRQAEQNQDPGSRICAIESCHLDARGARRIGEMEGFRDKPYDDQTRKYITEYKKGATIGWGHWINSRTEFEKYKNGITKEEAIKLKQQDLIKYERIVKKRIKVPAVSQDMYNALVSRAYNGGNGAFTARSNGSEFITAYINSGRKLNFDDPKDKDTQLFIAAYQRLDTSQHNYMRGVEFRRMRELDMMHHDYKEYSIKEYASRQLYGPGSKNKRWTRVFK